MAKQTGIMLAVGCLLGASAGVAAAAESAATTAAPAADAASAPEEIVVTGSRIARKDYVSESPIVSVGQDAIANSGPATLGVTLNQLPQFSASSSQSVAAGANQAARGGRENLNLRGLGIARTLVLIDGRRAQPSDPFGNAVDLNTLPGNIIGNIEVITGGASAVYGSDAVAGVVNVITRKNFRGVEFSTNYGQTSRTDGQTTDLGVLVGGSFADRGTSLISLSFMDRKAAYKDSRPFFDLTGDTNAPPAGRYTPSGNNLPSQAALNALFGSYGSTAPLPSQALSINSDGTLFATGPIRNLRMGVAQGFAAQPGNTGLVLAITPHAAGNILSPLKRYNGYGSWEYPFEGGAVAYANVNYTSLDISNQQRGQLNGTSPVATIPVTNPFLPADLRTILASRPNPNASFNYSFFGDRLGPAVFNYGYQVGQLTAGVKGDVGIKDWKYDVYATSGRTGYTQTGSGYVNIAAFQTLVNAADGGASICQGGFVPFSFAMVSPACTAYLTRTLKNTTTLDQQAVEANVQGGIAEMPAGELRFAAGLDFKRNAYTFLGDDQQTFSEVYFSRPVQNSGGAMHAYEAYGELLVPLLKDKPFARDVNLDLAYRYSDYNRIGGVSAYKASMDWKTSSWLRVRGGYQRAVRAPSVGELYGGGASVSANIGATTTGQGDPCDVTSIYRTGANAAAVATLCQAQGVPAGIVNTYRFTGTTVTVSQQGNPDLEAEKADTYTAGFVLSTSGSSPWISDLSLSADYYNIKIDGAIGFLSTPVALQKCFNGDGSNPTYSATNYYCTLLKRDANGNLSFPVNPEFNLAGYRTSGIDMELNWVVNLFDLGWTKKSAKIGLDQVVSHLNSYAIQNLAGSPFVSFAGTVGNTQVDTFTASHPTWKSDTTLSFQTGNARLAATWHYIGAMKSSTNVLTPAANVPRTAGNGVLDLSARCAITPKLDVRLGVQNVTDRAPPIVNGTWGSTDVNAYDILGRRYSLGFSARL